MSIVGAWAQRSLPTTAVWESVAYGNGIYVAIANGGTVAATSTDGGVTWVQRTLPASAAWRSIAFGNGVFVAISWWSSNIAATSTDGINWTQRTLPAHLFWISVVFGNGVFLATTDAGGKVATSPDGITWADGDMPTSGSWLAAAAGNGIFVALLNNSTTVATSTDGLTWASHTLPRSGFWRAVAFGKGLFVAVDWGSGSALTSADGITWDSRALPAVASWESVAYGSGYFVAVAYNTSNAAAISPDGIAWTPLNLPVAVDWQLVAHGATTFVAVASGGAVAATLPIIFSTAQLHERRSVAVLELDIDTCTNTYGVAPCTAAGAVGSECYNTFTTCQDKANYARGIQTLKFCTRGMAAPVGETIRPYIEGITSQPTEINPDKGLAVRSTTSFKLTDEPCADYGLDPYAATRAAPARGTYWTRFLARTPNSAGRFARVRRGLIGATFDWSATQDELYVIETIKGPDSGGVTVVLADAIKLLDRSKLPAATDGKLTAALNGASHTGVAQSATWLTIRLSSSAEPIDDVYNGQEVYILDNIGAGQRRVITDYEGATRTATLATAWAVMPEGISTYEVSPLSLTLTTGKGTQYPDPATSGKPEFVRVGDEIIRYTAKSGDMLSWPDGTYRGQFGSTREAQKKDAVVQLCRAWVDVPPATVLEEILNEGGIADSLIDRAELAAEIGTWLAIGANITACISKPETVSALYAELLRDLSLFSWWHPVEQLVKFRANMPALDQGIPALTDDDFIMGSVKIERLDAERITDTTIRYAMRSATGDEKKAGSYGRAEMVIDEDAKSPEEFGDSRPEEIFSRWLSAANQQLVMALAYRRLVRRRNIPIRAKFRLDPRTAVAVGDLRTMRTRWYTDAAGAPLPVQVRIVKLRDVGTHLEVEALNTAFTGGAGRPFFIAPAGQPDYNAATAAQRAYAYLAPASGTFDDGTSAYTII